MKHYFKFSYGVALIGLLTTACQKENMPILDQNLASTTTLTSKGPARQPNSQANTSKESRSRSQSSNSKSHNRSQSSNSKSHNRSPSPNNKSYKDHKELLSKGGYNPTTFDKYSGKHFNDYYKDYKEESGY
ncbi:MAG: hypothetical protein E6Q66_02345 [Pedobacter sp.]|nr:MAG: hypothetical protein E6Q66_02345 [Pedobacter sp.]